MRLFPAAWLGVSRSTAACVAVVLSGCQAATQANVPAPVPASADADAGHLHAPQAAGDTVARDGRATPTAHAPAHQMSADTRFMHHMLAHHAQALVMTELVPPRSMSNGVRLLAERITISQRDEIALIRRWLEQRGQPVPTAAEAEHMRHASMPGMLTQAELERLAAASGREFDRLFLELMIRHHEGALVMVADLFRSQGAAQDSELFRLASDIDADQRAEIARMRGMLAAMAQGETR